MSKANLKVDLTLLKRLVAELETTLNTAETIRIATPIDSVELMVEGSKASGIAAGIMSEAGALIMDIRDMLDGGTSPKSKNDLLDKLLGNLKGPGHTN